MRSSGILLPIFSIPSEYGVGSLGKEAYKFIDFLERSGQKIWQILPLGPTGYGDSPYQSFSTFAGNPYFIDLDILIQEGYLSTEECRDATEEENESYVNYEELYHSRFKLLLKAYENSHVDEDKYNNFVKKNAYWLDDYALFMAVKDAFDGKCWIEWDSDIRLRTESGIKKYRKKYGKQIEFYRFLQYMFALQWTDLKTYANKKGIEIVGDIPIYVAFDSADTWAGPKLFQLDEDGLPIKVAGCPPDAFSSTGQLWGNPLYRWDYHKSTNYEWWMKRIAYCYELYDVVRIDHFRGFDEYYAIPYKDPTAEFGTWEKGPGYDIFKTMKETLGNKKVIAEDLGFLTDSVIKMVKKTGYPGMKILQFAFNAEEESPYLPHNYISNCVVYTGTHDNDTILGWYENLGVRDRNFVKRYLDIKGDRGVSWKCIRAALASVADTAIIPLQDYLELGSSARINTPSTLGDNWKWRVQKEMLTEELADKIRRMTKLYGRL